MGVYWNGVKVATVAAQDEEIHTLRIAFLIAGGIYNLEITGEGASDEMGMAIGSVELVKSYTDLALTGPAQITGSNPNFVVLGLSTGSNFAGQSPNLIKNGRFENNLLGMKDWVITKTLPDWEIVTGEIEQRKGSIDNVRWGSRPVVELDGSKNNIIRQTLTLERGYYILTIEYAARVGAVFSSGMGVYLNGIKIGTVAA